MRPAQAGRRAPPGHRPADRCCPGAEYPGPGPTSCLGVRPRRAHSCPDQPVTPRFGEPLVSTIVDIGPDPNNRSRVPGCLSEPGITLSFRGRSTLRKQEKGRGGFATRLPKTQRRPKAAERGFGRALRLSQTQSAHSALLRSPLTGIRRGPTKSFSTSRIIFLFFDYEQSSPYSRSYTTTCAPRVINCTCFVLNGENWKRDSLASDVSDCSLANWCTTQ